jgi:hypothetical protein
MLPDSALGARADGVARKRRLQKSLIGTTKNSADAWIAAKFGNCIDNRVMPAPDQD